MRLELLMTLDRPILPKSYSKLFLAYLKNTISNWKQGQCFEHYFGGTKIKDYSFSVILSKPVFKEEVIELANEKIKMIFTADDRHQTGLVFFAAFIQQKNKRFLLPEGNAISLKKINPLREELIMSPKVVFKTITGSGLVVRQHDNETNRDRYFTFQDEGFDTRVKEVLSAQAKEAGFSEEIAQNIGLSPIQCKKVVVKQFGVYIDATVGVFEIAAAPEVLQYFYQAGVGSRHSQGFGTVDILSQE